MKVCSFLLSTLSALYLMTFSVNSEEASPLPKNEQLEYRIAELESLIASMTEVSANAELAAYSYDELSQEIDDRIIISGYADVEYKGSSHEGVNEEFRMHHLSLFFTKKFKNNIKFFSEIEYEDAPKFDSNNNESGELKSSTGKIFVEAVNFDWNYSQHINIRAGRFFTPAGIWSEDHYPTFVTTQERPMHIRKIFPQLVDGISFFGNTELIQNHFFNYTAYIGNGKSNVSGKMDVNAQKAVGFKADYYAPYLDEFTLGFSVYNDANDVSNNNADNTSTGVHLKLRHKNISLQAEYAKGALTYASHSLDYETKGYYSQITYDLNQWTIGYRYDVHDKTNLNNEEVQRNSIFANYHVNEHFRVKIEYHDDSYKELTEDDNGFYIFSITGFLGK